MGCLYLYLCLFLSLSQRRYACQAERQITRKASVVKQKRARWAGEGVEGGWEARIASDAMRCDATVCVSAAAKQKITRRETYKLRTLQDICTLRGPLLSWCPWWLVGKSI